MATFPLSSGISQRANDVRARRPQAKIGALAASQMSDIVRTLVNENPQAVQISEIAVNDHTDSHEYVVVIDGVEVSYTSDASATVAEIANGLAAAVEVEPRVRGQVTAESDGVDTVTLTGLTYGMSFDVSTEDATGDLAITTPTSASEAEAVAFGLGVISTGMVTDEAYQTGILVSSSQLTAQVDTLTIVYAAAEVYYVTITVDGQTYQFGVVADTDTATTCTAIAAAINAQMPANTVIASGVSGTTVTLTAEVAGKAFVTSVGTKSGTASRNSLAHTTAGLTTDVARAFAGVSLYTTDESNVTVAGDDVVYPANAGMMVVARGDVWVECSESPNYGDPVYIGTGTSEKGMFFASSSSTRILLPKDKVFWLRAARADANDNIAVLRLNLQ